MRENVVLVDSNQIAQVGMPQYFRLTRTQIYYLLQVSGWSAVAFREIINYTFFILNRFEWAIAWTFLLSSVYGFLLTHSFRFFIKRSKLFELGLRQVLIAAFVSVIVLALVLGLCSLSVGFILGYSNLNDAISIGYFLGLAMNWIPVTTAWVMAYFLVHILEQNNKIAREKLEALSTARASELELLKKQLNPHFLFNALNSIKALVIIDSTQAREAIVKLSELLRFTLNYEKHPLIPLKAELEEVEKYLTLEIMRFGARLEYNIECEEACSEVLIPPALILTLAENAVKHGISELPDGGLITIRATIHDNTVTIIVTNPVGKMKKPTGGIGLRHVQERMNALLKNPGFILNSSQADNVSASISFTKSEQLHEHTYYYS